MRSTRESRQAVSAIVDLILAAVGVGIGIWIGVLVAAWATRGG